MDISDCSVAGIKEGSCPMKKQSSLPLINLSLGNILDKADSCAGVMTYDSEIRGYGYAADKDGLIIISGNNGYIRISESNLDKAIEEIQYIREDIRRRQKW